MNKKTFMAAIIISGFLISLVGVQFVQIEIANWLFPNYTPITDLPTITIQSPKNGINYGNPVYLNFTIAEPASWFNDNTPLGSIYSISYFLDGDNYSIYQIPNWSLDNIEGTKTFDIPLNLLLDVNHNLQLTVEGASFYIVSTGGYTVENKEWTFNVTKTIDFTLVPTPSANLSPSTSPTPTPTSTPSPSPSPSPAQQPTTEPTKTSSPSSTIAEFPISTLAILFLTLTVLVGVFFGRKQLRGLRK